MLVKNTAARLSETVKGVETISRFALAVLALASGVYTYLGVRELLDGSASFVFFAAIIYSAAVSVAIYAFWSFMMRFVPLVVSSIQRLALFAIMAIGCAMIIAMSSWLNAAALAGSAALEQHLAVGDLRPVEAGVLDEPVVDRQPAERRGEADLMAAARGAEGIFSAVDISHRNVAFLVSGTGAATTLASACPHDLRLTSFPVGAAARTLLAKAEVVLWRQSETEWHVECWRSFAPYVFGLLREGAKDAALA